MDGVGHHGEGAIVRLVLDTSSSRTADATSAVRRGILARTPRK